MTVSFAKKQGRSTPSSFWKSKLLILSLRVSLPHLGGVTGTIGHFAFRLSCLLYANSRVWISRWIFTSLMKKKIKVSWSEGWVPKSELLRIQTKLSWHRVPIEHKSICAKYLRAHLGERVPYTCQTQNVSKCYSVYCWWKPSPLLQLQRALTRLQRWRSWTLHSIYDKTWSKASTTSSASSGN